MSLRNFTPNQNNNNTSSELAEYEEPMQNVGIYSDVAWVYIPQSGKKRAKYPTRFDDKTGLLVKRDPVTEQDWETVTPGARPRIKQNLHDVIVVEKKQEDGTVAQYTYLQFRVIPLTSYTDWYARVDGQGNAKRGGRQMWKVVEDLASPKFGDQIQGPGEGIACSSPDGVAPLPGFVGQEFMHKALKKKITIGKDARGNDIPADKMCALCPFNDWSNGKPPCGTSWKYLAWAPAQMDVYGEVMEATLVVISGPYSIQAAFTGQKSGSKWGHATRNLPRWDDLVKATGGTKKYIAIDDVTEGQVPMIIGVTSSVDKMAHYKGREYSKVSEPLSNFDALQAHIEGVINSGELDKVTHVEIKESSYPFAPEGLNGPIYPLEMISVINNNAGSEQRIPMLTGPKDDDGTYIFEPLEPKEVQDFYADWSTALQRRALWEKNTRDNIATIEAKRRGPVVSTPTDSDDMENMPSAAADMVIDDLDE